MSGSLLILDLLQPQDGVMARQRARQIAGILGFEAQDQTRLATAVSEVARNAFQYAGGAKIEFILDEPSRAFMIRIVDHGPASRMSPPCSRATSPRQAPKAWGSKACAA